MPIRNRKSTSPTVEIVSNGPKELVGNSVAETWGARRPKTDGPMRMPPIISPITRAWPTLSASQPQLTVINRTMAIWVRSKVMPQSIAPAGSVVLPYHGPDDKLLSLERLSTFETLLFLSFHPDPDICRSRGIRTRGNARRPSARGIRTLSRQQRFAVLPPRHTG